MRASKGILHGIFFAIICLVLIFALYQWAFGQQAIADTPPKEKVSSEQLLIEMKALLYDNQQATNIILQNRKKLKDLKEKYNRAKEQEQAEAKEKEKSKEALRER